MIWKSRSDQTDFVLEMTEDTYFSYVHWTKCKVSRRALKC